MTFTIYSSSCVENAKNTFYKTEYKIFNVDELKKATSNDYVCAKYKDFRRCNDNFISSDCLAFDCDNTHSQKPEDWVSVQDVRDAFPGVSMAVHYSRNNMKEKNGAAARPKFHVFFPITEITDSGTYVELKNKVCSEFPFFDENAVDAGRFFFGTPEANVEIYPGNTDIITFIESDNSTDDGIIAEGNRNTAMFRYACKTLKRYGAEADSYSDYIDYSAKCVPPLSKKELDEIWSSALKIYEKKVSTQPDYISPEEYNKNMVYFPTDLSDVGQGKLFAKLYGSQVKFSEATSFICFNGKYWEESDLTARGFAHELTRLQINQANRMQKDIAEKAPDSDSFPVRLKMTL